MTASWRVLLGVPESETPGHKGRKGQNPAAPGGDGGSEGDSVLSVRSVRGVASASTTPAPLDAGELRARYEERAGVFEHDGGLPRPEAELRAWTETALDWLEADPERERLASTEARRAAAEVLAAAGIADPESEARKHPKERPAPVAHLITCAACGARTWRNEHPTFGLPARCGRCEDAERARLLRLAGRGAIAPTRACAGCRERMPETGHALCFACDLGLDRADEAPARVRVAVELREQHGPAGGRGLRAQAIDAELKRRATRQHGASKTSGSHTGDTSK